MKKRLAANNRSKLVIDHQVRRLNLIQRYKAMVGCSRCGENDARCLDLHHIDPKTKHEKLKKDRTRGGLQGLNYREIVEEIKKCKVLCSNCHRKIETKLRIAPPLIVYSPKLQWAEEQLGLFTKDKK